MIDTLIAAVVLDREPPASRSAPSAAVSFLRCVVAHESHGNARAENPSSSASGLFQFIDGTWRHYARRVPAARRYSHAAHAPAIVQWQVALLAVKWHGYRNWAGTGCGYGT
jgi:hypothetical protein